MKHRIFFYTSFLVFAAAAITALLFKLNYLPHSLHDFIASRLAPTTVSSAPYLEKFEGRWSVGFEPSVNGTDVVSCASQNGYLTIHNGSVTGSMGEMASQVQITANVDQGGSLSGKTLNADQVGTITAQLSNGQGTGEIIDAVDCRGEVTLTKLDPVIDPVVGKFVSSKGDVTLTRGGTSSSLNPSEPLYTGDLITVPDGSTAFLTLGLLADPVNLTGPTTYTVPAK